MRVGIVTQPLQNNYGGILQNWALQQALKDIGHEPITLDVGLKYGYGRYALSIGKYFADRLMGRSRRFPSPPCHGRLASRLTGEFFHRHIIATEPARRYSAGMIDRYHLDAIVVGSDQVWRPLYNDSIEDMFLRFAEGRDVKRVAYAASFGVDEWELTEAQTAACRPLAQAFDAVSVREASGVELCREHLDVEAVHVLDPTMLIDVARYHQLCADIPRGEPFVAAYCIDLSDEKLRFFDEVAAGYGLPLKLFSANGDVSLSVEQWLSMFRDAAVVITDSFHGTVFSILNRKDFYTLGNASRGSARFIFLLSAFGLESRLVTDLSAATALSPIAWYQVTDALNQLRDQSLSFLREALS